MLYEFKKNLIYAFFPRRCVVCEKVLPSDVGVCKSCQEKLYSIQGPICEKCGREKQECLCDGYKYFHEGIYAPFYYENELAKSIRAFKFNGRLQNAHFYAERITKYLSEIMPGFEFDLVTCVPLSRKSLKKRGYNQSAILAKEISCLTGFPCNDTVLEKIYETPAQHTLASVERRGNLIGAFGVKKGVDLKDKTILLCDDIATTGTTLNECAKMLLLSGAKKVSCATVSVTKKEIK